MKSLIVVLALSCLYVNGFSQSPASVKALNIGDEVPDIVFNHLINYKNTSAKLSDFRGKVVILDFWATWCLPCIKGLPELNSLSKEFGDQIQILAISYEKQDDIKRFLKRKPEQYLTIVPEDTQTNYLFPRNSIPHGIVINKEGKVIAITSSAYINEKVISAVLAGKSIQLPLKIDVSLSDTTAYKWANREALSKNVFFQTAVGKRVYGMSGRTVNKWLQDSSYVISHTNLPITHLYLYGFNKPGWYRTSRVYLDHVKDSTRYVRDLEGSPSYVEDWEAANDYSYYSLTPPGIDIPTAKKIMIQQLDTAFGRLFHLRAFMDKRKIRCYYLTGLPDRKILAKGSDGYSFADSEKDQLEYHAVTLDDFATRLEISLYVPIVNKMDSNTRIDFTIPLPAVDQYRKTKDINIFRRILQPYGMDLKEGEEELEVLVLKEF